MENKAPRGHLLKSRKNAGTSCLLVVLVIILIALVAFYYSLQRKNRPLKLPALTPALKADTVTIPPPVDTVMPEQADTLSTEERFRQRLPRMISQGDYLLVEKSQFRLRHFRDGKVIGNYPVALGKNPDDKTREGDNATPEGYYEVNFIKDASTWTHDFKDGKGVIKGAYGPFFIALYTGAKGSFSGKTWRGIGIHGTHNPSSIGTNASEGCIRLHNNDLLILKKEIENKPHVPIDIIP